ncbi:hypothetical protein B0J15DRAFT_245194 [Fusarium solani]|uniref:Uncharacterized protein n=1 Tax=Fusarium solani TaxID=169388 RepID=A0A9P9HYP9_FUSSL|nr:uncharacterized protein B0J15DRAFT_245194 [Fusarium solani]KAH7266343.1 hypothetical protein B0J15DRAFT_245194 [Fusarium solani]
MAGLAPHHHHDSQVFFILVLLIPIISLLSSLYPSPLFFQYFQGLKESQARQCQCQSWSNKSHFAPVSSVLPCQLGSRPSFFFYPLFFLLPRLSSSLLPHLVRLSIPAGGSLILGLVFTRQGSSIGTHRGSH